MYINAKIQKKKSHSIQTSALVTISDKNSAHFIRRSGAFLFLVFSPAFLRLFFSFSYTFLILFFCFLRKEKRRKDQEKTRKDKKRQEIGGSVNLINLRNYPGNTFVDVKSMRNADSGLVLV